MLFDPDDALIVVDVQRDFCLGGALPIADCEEIVPLINRLIEDAMRGGALIVASRDWHPRGHSSFHDRAGPWPEHCVQGSIGAMFHEDLRLPREALVISKGSQLDSDQYSVFDGTKLAEELFRRRIRRVTLCGLALDVCVRASALDALRAGFEARIPLSATRPSTEAKGKSAIHEMANAGVVFTEQ
jgi:nicotinamidase/pyrazinamidase